MRVDQNTTIRFFCLMMILVFGVALAPTVFAAVEEVPSGGRVCDTQCQLDMLRTQLNSLRSQVQLLQSKVSSTPQPVYAYCKNYDTLASSTGQTWSCDPFICQGSACVKVCGNQRDCAAPYVCNAGGVCVPPPH